MLVCIATVQSMQLIEHGDSFVFLTPPSASSTVSRHKHSVANTIKPRSPSMPSSLGAKQISGQEVMASSSDTQLQEKLRWENNKSSSNGVPFFADISNQMLDHDLLTRDEEYELGMKIRKFIDTKKKIDEMVERKKKEQEQRRIENLRQREKEADKRRELYEGLLYGDDDGDLSMEEELEELLVMNRLQNKIGDSRSGLRNSLEDLYGSFDDEDNEEAIMEDLGMAVYGLDNYRDDDSGEDDLAIIAGSSNYYESNDDNDFPPLPETSDSSQIGDTLNDIRFLTDREIEEDLGIDGGRKELSQILIQGALAKQQMIKSNIRLVISIAQKWMRGAKGSGSAGQNSDNEKKLSRAEKTGDWSTPSMDEVIQQGIVGLAIAAERFEPERKFKFSTYATYYVTNEVRNVFQSATTQCLYVPPYFYTIKNKYQKLVKEHYRKTAGNPELALSMEDIARQLDLKLERLQFILKSTQSLVQLDAPIGNGATLPGKAGGNDNTLNDPFVNYLPSDDPTPESIVELSLLRQCIENAMAAELLPLERDIVRLRNGLDDGKSRTAPEIMRASGGMLSVGDIRNLESRAYKKLRFQHSVHNARLREFAVDFIGMSPELLDTTI